MKKLVPFTETRCTQKLNGVDLKSTFFFFGLSGEGRNPGFARLSALVVDAPA
jgi:hypothetical protein